MSVLLQTSKVSMHFGGVRAVDLVDTSINSGAIHGLIGPNGAGKTTLFNIISGLYIPTTGNVIFEGKDITDKKPHEVTKLGIARTFQNILLFDQMSALENVMVGHHSRTDSTILGTIFHTPKMKKQEVLCKDYALSMLDFVGLSDFKNNNAGSLPYGQKRVLEIARALASKPKIIMLDEPCAGMNPSETDYLIEIIYKIRDFGITVLMVEHNMRVAMGVCDIITVLDHGKKIAEDVPDIIQNDQQVIEAYLGKENLE